MNSDANCNYIEIPHIDIRTTCYRNSLRIAEQGSPMIHVYFCAFLISITFAYAMRWTHAEENSNDAEH